MNNAITLKESILKSTNIGKDAVLKDVYNNTLNWLNKNNLRHLNLDKLYIRDYSSVCKYEKIIYDEINKKISFQKVRDVEIIYQLDELKNT